MQPLLLPGSVCPWTIAACAAPGRVCSTADSGAPGLVILAVFFPRNYVPFQASEWLFRGPRNTFGKSNFFRGITEPIPSLFRGIFSERNSVANPKIR
jgi:hypothetical protein